jgi:tetratricopeptide (TPR) repeat protein
VAASRIRDHLLGCLHELELWYLDADPGERKQVTAVLRAAKQAAGGVLGRWQAATDARDVDGLVAVSAGPDVLELGPMLINALGRQLSGARRFPALLDLLRRSADRYPEFPWVHFDLMLACTQVVPPQPQEALRHAAAAAALAPNSPTFQYHLSLAYTRTGAHDRAAECARKTIALAPQWTGPRVILLDALLATGDTAAAGAALMDALAVKPDNLTLTLWLMGLQKRKEGPAQRAAVLRAAAGRFDPTAHPAAACRRLAAVLESNGLHAEALAVLMRALDQKPEWSADPADSLRFPAARCAIKLAAGSADPPSLRGQARDWLAAELAATRKLTATDPQFVHNRMSHWLEDDSLAAVRNQAELEKLPIDERVAWVKLWTAVRELRDATAPPEQAPPPRAVR